MIRNWHNQIPYPALKTKREITKYINWQQFTNGTPYRPIEQLFPGQVVIQNDQVTVRNHNRSTALERSVLKYCGMRRLIYAFVVRMWHKTYFLMAWLISICISSHFRPLNPHSFPPGGTIFTSDCISARYPFSAVQVLSETSEHFLQRPCGDPGYKWIARCSPYHGKEAETQMVWSHVKIICHGKDSSV